MSEQNQFASSVLFQLQHLDRIAQVEMKDLLASQSMQTGEGIRGQQVIDSRGHCSPPCITGGQRSFRDIVCGSVRLDEIPALDRMGFQLQEVADLLNCQ